MCLMLTQFQLSALEEDFVEDKAHRHDVVQLRIPMKDQAQNLLFVGFVMSRFRVACGLSTFVRVCQGVSAMVTPAGGFVKVKAGL